MSIQNTPADLGGRQAGREDAIDLPAYLARMATPVLSGRRRTCWGS